ncbi:hypothetical protein ACOME3_007031 [Neoechinorhynchus agilis]
MGAAQAARKNRGPTYIPPPNLVGYQQPQFQPTYRKSTYGRKRSMLYSQAVRMGLLAPNQPMPPRGQAYVVPLRPRIPIYQPRMPDFLVHHAQPSNDVSRVAVLTGLSEALIRNLYSEFLIITNNAGFMSHCNLKETIRSLIPDLQSNYLDALTNLLFTEMDRDRNNVVDFWEFVMVYKEMIQPGNIFAPLLPSISTPPMTATTQSMEQLLNSAINPNNPLVNAITQSMQASQPSMTSNPMTPSNPLVKAIISAQQPFDSNFIRPSNPLVAALTPPNQLPQQNNPLTSVNPLTTELTRPTLTAVQPQIINPSNPIVTTLTTPTHLLQPDSRLYSTLSSPIDESPRSFESLLASTYSPGGLHLRKPQIV